MSYGNEAQGIAPQSLRHTDPAWCFMISMIDDLKDLGTYGSLASILPRHDMRGTVSDQAHGTAPSC